MGVKVIFLLNCPLVLSLLKHKSVRAFLNKKMRNPNRKNPLNNSIDRKIRKINGHYLCDWFLNLKSVEIYYGQIDHKTKARAPM